MGKETSSVFTNLETYDAESGDLNVIIDTPKGSRNKFEFNEKYALFSLGGVLPAGAVFPFDFGFVPSTLGGDGDPLDVLVVMDEPAFVGCLVPSRLIGVIEAEQTEEGKTERNDRLIAVASGSRVHREVRSLEDVSAQLVEEIEHFFVSYNAAKDKEFKPLGRFGPERAEEIVKEGMASFRGEQEPARKKRSASK
ncbi:MAG: inorganic diphosphatase [Pyrinomonadaceae bacterium]|jgi:inorganic pyrophosphatase|nr:inorganic diphosphatase [Pyrinomonadaceae bacterium]